MRSMTNDHVGGIEWLRSILQPQEGNSTVTASPELLAKAQQQVSKKKFMMSCHVAAVEVYSECTLINLLEALLLLLVIIIIIIKSKMLS